MKKILTPTASLALVLTLIGAPALAQEGEKPITASVEGHIFKPARVDATDARLKQLKVPAGFQITKFAEGLNKPRMIALSNDGVVYVTDRDKGTVTMLRDTNKDGKADEKKVVATKEHMHGIAIKDNKVWLADRKSVV